MATIKIEIYGRGGNSGVSSGSIGAGGGGGGAYSRVNAFTVSSGTYVVAFSATSGEYITFNSNTCYAQNGYIGTTTGGQGGQAANGAGDVKYSGGTGGNGFNGGSGFYGGGGGSSATDSSDGVNGNNGANGVQGTGGNNGSGAGTGGTAGNPAGSNGANYGGGGGGSYNIFSATTGGAGKVVLTYTTALFTSTSVTGAGNSIATQGENSIATFVGNGNWVCTVASVAPTITTGTVTSITETTATGAGNVTSDGGASITERGVVVSTSINPTTSDAKFTASGTTGSFTASITGRVKKTLYYVRAFATNSVGTSYGDNVTFTTKVYSPFPPFFKS